MARFNPFCGNQGFGLVGVLALTGATALGVMGILTLNNSTNRSLATGSFRSSVLDIKSTMGGLLQHSRSWQAIKTANANLACIQNGTDCWGQKTAADATEGLPLTIVDPTGNLFKNSYDSGNAQHGFTHFGTPCTTFDPAGNENCPLRVEARWRPLCTEAANCVNPPVLVQLTYIYRPLNTRYPFNPAKYEQAFILRTSGVELTQAMALCNAMRGTFDLGNGKCLMPYETCGSDQVWTRQASGTWGCSAIVAGAVPGSCEGGARSHGSSWVSSVDFNLWCGDVTCISTFLCLDQTTVLTARSCSPGCGS